MQDKTSVPRVSTAGPLAGVAIVLVGGIGPAPFAAMLLADLGADVIRIERPSDAGRKAGVFARSQRSAALDLKSSDGVEAALQLFERADAIIEGFRPGVMERLGLGPEIALSRNPHLVYGRMTGWGQSGPMATTAGHDINYIALSGALGAIGTREAPVMPLNLVGDFGGGSMYLVMGLLSGILHARSHGGGQVVDSSMTEGSASLMTMYYGIHAQGRLGERGTNMLDGGAPFYGTFKCGDNRWIAIGAIEPQFYEQLRSTAGLTDPRLDGQMNTCNWPTQKALLAEIFATRPRDEWIQMFAGSDACVTPVLDLAEAPHHPHNKARNSFVELGGEWLPAPAPRFSATPAPTPRAPSPIGADTCQVLRDWGVAESVISRVAPD
jgi:alpha-methylacyl-CoA racemase